MGPKDFPCHWEGHKSYVALTTNSFHECLGEIMKRQKSHFCHRQQNCFQPNARNIFLTGSSCQKLFALDKRTYRGLKTERNGTEKVWLKSNTCCVFNEPNKKMEMALQGRNDNPDLPLQRFKSVFFYVDPYEGSDQTSGFYNGNFFIHRQSKMLITCFWQ